MSRAAKAAETASAKRRSRRKAVFEGDATIVDEGIEILRQLSRTEVNMPSK